MARPVYIHAGAHRTGTSSFQLCLSQNRARLAAAGFDVAYPGRDGVGGGKLRLQLPRPRHGLKRVPEYGAMIRAHLAKLCPDGDRALILSEENIPGPMRHFYEGRFFPAAAKRFLTLNNALEQPAVHVIYVLRSYAEIYVSAYRKRAEDNAVPPFADIVPQFLAMDRGWPELVADMRDLLGADRLTVLPYERRGSSSGLLKRLVPDLGAVDLAEPERTMNLSATDSALAALQKVYRAGGTLGRQHWRAVMQDHAGDTTRRGLAAFSAPDAKILDARYTADLDRVAALEGVTFL